MSIELAEQTLVLADEAEQSGDEGQAQLLSRVAGSMYERAGRFDLAERAYRRGEAHVRARLMATRQSSEEP